MNGDSMASHKFYLRFTIPSQNTDTLSPYHQTDEEHEGSLGLCVVDRVCGGVTPTSSPCHAKS